MAADEEGKVVVDEADRTTTDNVYAIGDTAKVLAGEKSTCFKLVLCITGPSHCPPDHTILVCNVAD